MIRGSGWDRRILALAAPALAALVADPLLSLVDTAFVGRLGRVELAALGVDTALFGMAFAVCNFLAFVTTPMVSQSLGRGDRAGAGRVVSQAVVTAIGLGVVGVAVFWVASGALVGLMQASAEVTAPAVEYLRIRALAFPAALLNLVSHGIYRGYQDTRTPMWVSVGVNAFNAALDPVLIFGLGWGLAGAGWATVAAQWLGVGCFYVLLSRRASAEGWSARGARWGELLRFWGMGAVLALRTLFLVLTLTLSVAAAARVGTLEVAAHQIMVGVWALCSFTLDSMAIAGQALVGEQTGRGDIAAAHEVTKRLLGWGVVMGVVIAGLLLASVPWLGGVFTDDRAVAEAVRGVVPQAAVMQPLAGLVFVADGIFMAVLAVRLLAASTGAGLVAAAGVLWISDSAGWGLSGVWWAILAMLAARSCVFIWGGRRGLGKWIRGGKR
ncbi:MAG: MATE family efflux transporter [bacterium]|nr:MATE family efflux transporter [bacterium]MDE0601187.1 MATE family efflux transporter [bacterium]